METVGPKEKPSHRCPFRFPNFPQLCYTGFWEMTGKGLEAKLNPQREAVRGKVMRRGRMFTWCGDWEPLIPSELETHTPFPNSHLGILRVLRKGTDLPTGHFIWIL